MAATAWSKKAAASLSSSFGWTAVISKCELAITLQHNTLLQTLTDLLFSKSVYSTLQQHNTPKDHQPVEQQSAVTTEYGFHPDE